MSPLGAWPPLPRPGSGERSFEPARNDASALHATDEAPRSSLRHAARAPLRSDSDRAGRCEASRSALSSCDAPTATRRPRGLLHVTIYPLLVQAVSPPVDLARHLVNHAQQSRIFLKPDDRPTCARSLGEALSPM